MSRFAFWGHKLTQSRDLQMGEPQNSAYFGVLIESHDVYCIVCMPLMQFVVITSLMIMIIMYLILGSSEWSRRFLSKEFCPAKTSMSGKSLT